MEERIGLVLDMVDLTERKDSKVETFSGSHQLSMGSLSLPG